MQQWILGLQCMIRISLFIAVGTPSNADGSIDLTYVLDVCEEVGNILREKEGFHIVIIKSTVFPGTTDDRVRQILEYTSGKKGRSGISG